MNRLIPVLSALAVSCAVLSSVAAMPTHAPRKAAMIGADKPVNLGSMVVTATAL